MSAEERGKRNIWLRALVIVLIVLCLAALGGIYITVRHLGRGADPRSHRSPVPCMPWNPFMSIWPGTREG